MSFKVGDALDFKIIVNSTTLSVVATVKAVSDTKVALTVTGGDLLHVYDCNSITVDSDVLSHAVGVK